MHLFGFFDCFGCSGSGQVSRQALRALCFPLALNFELDASMAFRRGTFMGHRSISHPNGSTQDAWTAITCGYCGSQVSAAVVSSWHPESGFQVKWVQCPNCGNGSVIAPTEVVYPAVRFGPEIIGMPDEVAAAYNEARDCMAVSALTACELICRKILMHIAVEKSAKEGDTFASYVSYLEKQGYVTPPMKPWVDQIRQIGNAATHELNPPSRNRAESTLMFTAELLRLVYEMEAMTRRYAEEDA